MKELEVFALNIIILIVGMLIVVENPLSAIAITFGMILISASIIYTAINIYFPSSHEKQSIPLTVARARAGARRARKGLKKTKRK